jgi:hypothetical protein
VAVFLSPKGYRDGAIVGLGSTGVGSLGGGGAELDDGASPCTTGTFPMSRLRLERSPTKDLVPTARHGIPAECSVSP